MGEVKIGDVFYEKGEKIIVLGFEKDAGLLFANTTKFSKQGYTDENVVSVASLYKLNFITNINDL